MMTNEVVENLLITFDGLMEAVRKAWRKIFSWLFNGTRRIIRDIALFVEKKAEKEKCFLNNQNNRSSWVADWDTRQKSQVINKKPQFINRKIIR